jgi:hypothetical protein
MRSFLLSSLLFSYMAAQAQITITDADLTAGNTYNWTANNVYLLDGTVYLEAGATLNIEAGTVIKGVAKQPGQPFSSLIVCRDAQIFANGTQQNPIIFTAESDNLSGNLDETDRGLWGGLVILGRGKARKNGLDSFQVEGIQGVEPRALMGGFDNNDNSGILRYVSIRHAGFEIAAGNELNGLTLGAVGAATTLEYIEVFAGSDDGFEFFGGKPNTKFLVSAFNDDDAFDWDNGFRGKGQFWFAIQAEDAGQQLFEVDGAEPDADVLWSNPTVFNATLIGSGSTNTVSPYDGNNLLFRDATGGVLANSIIFDLKGEGLQVEDLTNGIDAYQRMLDDSLVIANNLWFQFETGNTLDTTGFLQQTGASGTDDDCSDLINHLTSNGNAVVDPAIRSVGRFATQQLDPRPDGTESAVSSNLAPYNDPFFTQVAYKGAFNPNAPHWLLGWTTLDRNGYLADISSSIQAQEANEFGLYPNPAQESLSLSLNKAAQNETVEILDLNGRLLQSHQVTGTQVSLELGNLANGMYIVRFRNSQTKLMIAR